MIVATRSNARIWIAGQYQRIEGGIRAAAVPVINNTGKTKVLAQLLGVGGFAASERVFVTCMAMHRGDDDAVVEWMGHVVQPEFTDTQLKLTCDPTIARRRAKGGGRRVQRACEVAVYGQGLGQCNLLKEAFAIPAVAASVIGLSVTAPELAAAPMALDGGFVEWTLPNGLVERRTIMSHAGSTIELDYGAFALEPALAFIAYPGCPHTWAACEERENTDNYGGCLNLPSKNPWSGNPP